MTQVTLGRFDKLTPHVNWSSRGLTKGTPPLLPSPYSREQVLDHDEVWAGLVTQMRDLRRLNDSMMLRGDRERAQAALNELDALAERVFYTYRVWERRGRWNRYYRVANSVRSRWPRCPPIGGHVIHPIQPPITRQTTPPRCSSLKSSPEHTGARHQKSTDTGELK